MEPILIGTNLQDIKDNDTLEQILRKIVGNQKSLFEQILEIVKFYNAAYSTEDNNAEVTSTVNTGYIKTVSLKYGILYVHYVGVNGTPEVIKFRLDSALVDRTKGGAVYNLEFLGEDAKIKDFPNSEKGSYAYGNGHIYLKDDTGWTLVDEAYNYAYFVYDNKLYKYYSDKGLEIAINAVHPDTLEDYATIEAVTEALSEVEDNVARTYNRIFVLAGYAAPGFYVDTTTLKANDYYIENNQLLQFDGLGPRVVDVNMDKAFFLYNNALFSIVDGVYTVHIKDNSSYLNYLSEGIGRNHDDILDVESKKSYIIPIVSYTVNKGVPKKRNFVQGSIAVDYNSSEKVWHYYKLLDGVFEEIELKGTFENPILPDSNVYLAFKGELWQPTGLSSGALRNVLGGGNYYASLEKVDRAASKVIYGRVLDTVEEVEEIEDPDALLSGTGNVDDIYVDYVLCLEDNSIWYCDYEHRFAYKSDVYNDVSKHIIFLDVDRGLYMKNEEGIYKCIISTQHYSVITNKTQENSPYLVTAGAVVGALKKKADKVNAILEGIPTAPTAPIESDSDQIATTKFVKSIIAALSISTDNFDGNQVLSDIEELYTQKVEFLYIDYYVEQGHNINELLHPTTGQKAIVINSETNYPELYTYREGSGWINQGPDVNAELRKPFAIIAWDNKLMQWDRNNNVYRTLIDNTSIIDDLWEQKVEFTYVDYIVADLSEIEEPAVGQHAILVEPGENPAWYSYRDNDTWYAQSEEVNEELTKKGTILSCNNALYQWSSALGQYIILIDGNAGGGGGTGSGDALNQLSPNSTMPVQSKVLYNILAGKASLDSPAFTGTPTAPTPVSTSNNNTIATTKFVKDQLIGLRNAGQIFVVDMITDIAEDIVMDSVDTAILVSSSDIIFCKKPSSDAVVATINDYAQVLLDNTNLYVLCDNCLYTYDVDLDDFKKVLDGNAISGIMQHSDRPVSSSALYTRFASKANLDSPNFTGNPTAPTVDINDVSERIATTRFVNSLVRQMIESSSAKLDDEQNLDYLDFGGDTDTNTPTDPAQPAYPTEDGSLPIDGKFDVLKRNLGTVVPDMDIKDIRATDIDETAYPLPELYPDLSNEARLGKIEGEDSIWTAEDIGLEYVAITNYNNVTSAEIAIGKRNTLAIKNALQDPHCVGFKLDKVYYLYVIGFSNATGNKSGAIRGAVDDYHRIYIPRDFIIDGEVNGVATGGFATVQSLFYIDNSLVLNKVVLTRFYGNPGGYRYIFVDCYKGIDLVKAKDCVITDPKGYASRIFYFHCENTPYHDGSWNMVAENYINHIYIDGCVCNQGGSEFVCSTILRVHKSCRIINNTLLNIVKGVAINMSTDNSKSHAGEALYVSCPIYIVDNTITGDNSVVRQNSMYYAPVLVESSALYCIHNTFSNFIIGETYYKDSNDNLKRMPMSVYDCYSNVAALYYCYNTVSDIILLSNDKDRFTHIAKSKGSGIIGGLYYFKHQPVEKHFVGNTYTLDEAHITELWTNRTYPSGTLQETIDKDALINVNDCICYGFTGLQFGLGLNSNSVTPRRIAIKEFEFSDNTINVGNGGFAADPLFEQNITAAHITIKGNTFTAARIVSDTYSGPRLTKFDRWLFNMWIYDYGYGKTSLVLKDNVFNVPNSNIHLLLAKYNPVETSIYGVLPEPAEAEINDISNNVCPASSTLVMKRYNYKTGKYAVYGANY